MRVGAVSAVSLASSTHSTALPTPTALRAAFIYGTVFHRVRDCTARGCGCAEHCGRILVRRSRHARADALRRASGAVAGARTHIPKWCDGRLDERIVIPAVPASPAQRSASESNAGPLPGVCARKTLRVEGGTHAPRTCCGGAHTRRAHAQAHAAERYRLLRPPCNHASCHIQHSNPPTGAVCRFTRRSFRSGPAGNA